MSTVPSRAHGLGYNQDSMILEKIYVQCLSLGSYFLADRDSKEAAVIDPQRDTGAYESLLQEGGYRLKYVLETHLHADFVSGHVDLAAKTGALIVFGKEARAAMPHLAVSEGEVLRLGANIEIKVMETPGHTPESVCYLARDLSEPGKPMKLFTGDTLFDGDVGRPDLLGAKLPASFLASRLYDSLRKKIMPLPDGTEVYPAHGAGSACGRNLGDSEFTTIGAQKRDNYALQPMDADAFIALVTEDQPEAPAYFGEDARLNREGPALLDAVLGKLAPLVPRDLAAAMGQGTVLLDTRGAEAYARGAIPGSIAIGLDGQFASWVGALIPHGTRLAILADPDRHAEAALRCARIGYDNVAGYLVGGLEAWISAGLPSETYMRSDAEGLLRAVQDPGGVAVLDVRRAGERAAAYVPGSLAIPLNQLLRRMAEVPKDKPILIHCAGGYRSSMAVSVFRRAGYMGVTDVADGLRSYAKRKFPLLTSSKP